MRVRAVLLVALLACTGILVLAPGALAAQRAPEARDVFKNIPVTGAIASGGTFAGTLDVQRFAAEGGALVAYGRLTGVLTETVGQARPVTKVVRLPVSTAGGAAARAPNAVCPILRLDLAPTHLDLLGLVVDLSAVHLRITAVSGPGKLLGNLLCAVAGLLDGNQLAATSRALNRAVRILNGPDVFRGIPVSGSTPTGGVFDGTLNIRRFEQRATGLVAVGFLRGSVTQVGGALTNVATLVAVPVSGPGASARTTAAVCPILRLVLGPLHLDLLGLVVDLNRVVLRITAVSGPGKLLGNLLCGLVGILDRQTAGAGATAATRLNTLRRLVARTQNIRIGGENGRFKGQLDIQRFYAKNGKLWALARLSGTLTRNGTPTAVTDRLVRVPVGVERGDRTIAARCSILRLVLGPLHLDLLGLVVDLNRVVLRITAVSGPGNLLGNLLCGLVGILDPGPIAGTAGRLTRNLLVLRQVTG